mgnify:CR=1 FL=1
MADLWKHACREAAIAAYEDGLIRGLCPQGAFELAMQAINEAALETPAMTKESQMPAIRIKRVYEPASDDDGFRVLVDRLWPRGIAKADSPWDQWTKDLAPSAELRKWFNHDAARWNDFSQKYRQELKSQTPALQALLDEAGHRPITLLYAARDTQHNQAIILQDVLTHLRRKQTSHE